jgi:uncharacterized protein (DUF58 family)
VSARSDRQGSTRTRGTSRGRTGSGGRTGSATSSAGDAFTGSEGLTNARTRIVGTRTGPLVDAVVAVVRIAHAIGGVLRTAAQRVGSVVTPIGWCVLVLVPLALWTGYTLAWVELVAVGWAAIVLLLLAALYLIGRTALEVDLLLPATQVVVGDRAVGRISVTNPRRVRVFGATVEIPVGDQLADVTIPGLAPGATESREFLIPTAHRGVVAVGPARTVRADPVGLVRRELVWTARSQVFVHPLTIAIPSMSTGFVRDLEGSPTRDLTTSDVSFHALREYLPGDERRSIHWKSTARTGRFMVRQFEETRRSHLLVALSLAEADYASGEEFELAVSAAGSLGARAIRDARDVTVVVGEATPDFAKRKVFAVRPLSTLTRSRLLDDLATVERAPSALSLVDVARVTAESVTGVSVAFLLCGSTITPAGLRAASAQFPLGVETVAIVCDLETVPGPAKAGALRVFTIGMLGDLQKSLARSAAL